MKFILALFLTVALAACGGSKSGGGKPGDGGGGGGGNPPGGGKPTKTFAGIKCVFEKNADGAWEVVTSHPHGGGEDRKKLLEMGAEQDSLPFEHSMDPNGNLNVFCDEVSIKEVDGADFLIGITLKKLRDNVPNVKCSEVDDKKYRTSFHTATSTEADKAFVQVDFWEKQDNANFKRRMYIGYGPASGDSALSEANVQALCENAAQKLTDLKDSSP